MGTQNIRNIGLSNGLLPVGTKSLPETSADLLSVRSSDIQLMVIWPEISQASITKISIEITCLKLVPFLFDSLLYYILYFWMKFKKKGLV